MAKKQVSFWTLLFEFVSVVFAVLLALGLNSYKQTLDLQNESKLLSSKILAECSRNLLEIDSVNRQNETYLNNLYALLTSEKEIEGFSIDFKSELLTSSSWQYTQTSPAFNYIDGSLINDATEVYELQTYYMKVSSDMFQNIGEMVLYSDDIMPKTLVKTSHYFTRNAHQAGLALENAYRTLLNDHQQK